MPRNDNTAIHFLCAYGRDLLIDSGSSTYGQHVINDYLQSSFSKNTIQVDGKGQNEQQMGSGNRGPNTTAAEPIANRWHTSEQFDLAEGFYASGYEDPKIQVRHERQIVFLRKPLVWIVTDRLRGENGTMPAGEQHTYTQTWNFPENFAQNQVTFDSAAKSIRTVDPKGPNVTLRHFARFPIQYQKFYGQENPMRGWIRVAGVENLKAVDLHATWQGRGEQLLVTLITPSKGLEPAIEKVKPLTDEQAGAADGFALTLKDGTRVTYQAALNSAPLVAGPVRATGSALVVMEMPQEPARGIVLDAAGLQVNEREQPLATRNFEFTVRDGRLSDVQAITYPPGSRSSPIRSTDPGSASPAASRSR